NPVCILFTELPPGLKPGDKLEVQVRFAGYFYKLYRYHSADKNKPRDAPLLIGHTVTVLEPPHEGDLNWFKQLIPLFLTLGCVVLGGLLFLPLSYRRADEQVRRRLAAIRLGEFVAPAPDTPPLATPVARPVRPEDTAPRGPAPPSG